MKINTKQGRGRAFTLIEVLVTIGIVLTLALLCLPVVQKSRDRGLTAKCAGNLKNIGASLTAYVADNRYYPSAQPKAGSWRIQAAEEYASSGMEPELTALSNMTKCPARSAIRN